MAAIDWQEVADKIRSRRFSEISDDAWNEIVIKITPKKRGRKPKATIQYKEDWSLEDLTETDQRYATIMAKYDRLTSCNVGSKKAFELIANNLDADGKPDNNPLPFTSAKNVERIVYLWNSMRNELNLAMQEEDRLE